VHQGFPPFLPIIENPYSGDSPVWRRRGSDLAAFRSTIMPLKPARAMRLVVFDPRRIARRRYLVESRRPPSRSSRTDTTGTPQALHRHAR